jgi:hypothetical protein
MNSEKLYSIENIKSKLGKAQIDFKEIANNYVQLKERTTIHRRIREKDIAFYATSEAFKSVSECEKLTERIIYLNANDFSKETLLDEINAKKDTDDRSIICIEDGNKILQPSSYKYNSHEIIVSTNEDFDMVFSIITDIDNIAPSSSSGESAVTEWVIICNPKIYDTQAAFENLKKVDWKQSTNVEVGDIVYIYEANPIGAIRFKCKVNKVNLNEIEIDDTKYETDGAAFTSLGRYMEIEPVYQFQTEIPKYKNLKEYGFNARTPQKVSNELEKYLNECERRDLMKKVEFNCNTILYGPPGTGKTYNTVIYAVAIIEGKTVDDVKVEANSDYKGVKERYNKYKAGGQIEFTTFHQSYGYEQFIEGIFPVIGNDIGKIQYELKAGVFKEFCGNAESNIQKKYVFIIDEINRGNISKIFGELITLIEPSKRLGKPEEIKAKLPYSPEPFGVPGNVYIVGTMNTADRSIAMIDTALRRRFSFVEMMPDVEVLEKWGLEKININGKELNVANMLETINTRIEFLLDREHTIGHAFFSNMREMADMENLKTIFSKNIIPLLQEYFYDDYEKIALVLGDNGKSDNKYRFIKCEEKTGSIFKGKADVEPREMYHINPEAFDNIESYIEIYEGADNGKN